MLSRPHEEPQCRMWNGCLITRKIFVNLKRIRRQMLLPRSRSDIFHLDFHSPEHVRKEVVDDGAQVAGDRPTNHSAYYSTQELSAMEGRRQTCCLFQRPLHEECNDEAVHEPSEDRPEDAKQSGSSGERKRVDAGD